MQLGACSSAPRQAVEVELAQESWVSVGSSAAEAKSKGDAVGVLDQPVLIEAPGHIGVLLVPVGDKAAKSKVALKPIENWGGDRYMSRINRVLSDTLYEINEIQTLLAAGRARGLLPRPKHLKTVTRN